MDGGDPTAADAQPPHPMPSVPATLTLRLSRADRARLQRLAEREGIAPEEAALRAIARAEEAASLPQERSALEAAGDLVGSFDGSPDLSTNETYLDDYGR